MNNRRWFFSWLLVILLSLWHPGAVNAATTTKMLYGSNNQTITCTLTSLGSAAKQSCTAVDNTTNLFLDALVSLKIKTGASGVSGTGFANIFAAGTADGGTTYSDGVACNNSSATLTVPTNLKLIGIMNMVSNATTYSAGPFSVSAAFNGVLPDHWCIVVDNETGAAFDGSVASSWYQGVQTQNL